LSKETLHIPDQCLLQVLKVFENAHESQLKYITGNRAWNNFCVFLDQRCSRERNLRDRDLVKISRPRLHQKLRDSSILPNFFLNVVITSELNCFNFWHFPTCFGCFLPANATNKNRWILEILLNYFFATFKVSRPVAFETETRKYGSRDSITGSDINAHCIYYREYWFPHCMLGSDGGSRCGLSLETSHFSSLSLEGLRSCLGLQKYGLVKLL